MLFKIRVCSQTALLHWLSEVEGYVKGREEEAAKRRMQPDEGHVFTMNLIGPPDC
jgi:hypothetical protein